MIFIKPFYLHFMLALEIRKLRICFIIDDSSTKLIRWSILHSSAALFKLSFIESDPENIEKLQILQTRLFIMQVNSLLQRTARCSDFKANYLNSVEQSCTYRVSNFSVKST